jgi:hypothetical protein
MAAFGLEDEIAAVPVSDQSPRFEIWAENRQTLMVFLALATQWDINSDGVRTNLKYASLPAVERYMPDVPPKKWPRIFNELRAMEAAALEVYQARRKEQLEEQKRKTWDS